MYNMTPDMAKQLNDAPVAAKKLLASILTEAILSSDIPEEHKIEWRIMTARAELGELVSETTRRFAIPIPPKDEETAKRIYPARRAFLEYLGLMKEGLENFLRNVPVPDIPPEYIKRVENPFDRG